MTISIIIPVYNKVDYIQQCLESIFEDIKFISNYFEVIIIDDGSTDGSKDKIFEIINKYRYLECNIAYKYQNNGGLGSACNLGIDLSNGEYIVMVDSDDFVHKGYFKEILKFTERYYADLMYFDLANVNPENNQITSRVSYGSDVIVSSLDLEPNLLLQLPSAKNKVFKKTLFTNNDIRFPNRLWFEDLATTIPLMTSTSKIVYIPNISYMYVNRNDSIVSSTNISKNKDLVIVLSNLTRYFKDRNIYNTFYNQLEYLYVQHYLLFGVTRIVKNGFSNDMIKVYKEEIKKLNIKPLKISLRDNFSFSQKLIIFMNYYNLHYVLWIIFKVKKLSK